VILVAAFYLAYVFATETNANRVLALQMRAVIDSAESLLDAIGDAETGQRGYVITGEDRYLEPYRSGSAAAEGRLNDLERLVAGDAEQTRRIAAIRPLLKAKLDEMAQTVEVRRSQGFDAARAIVLQDIGKSAMDEIRWRIGEVEAAESTLLDLRRTQILAYEQRALIAAAIGGLTATLALAITIALMIRNNMRLQTAEQTLAEEAAMLRAVLGNTRDGVLAFDVGAHTHQIASQWSSPAPQTFLITNGWSSMGFGLPAAIAAKLARPELPVVCLIGDGCFQMTCGEVATAKRLGITLPVVVLDDRWLALIKVKQMRRQYPLYGTELQAEAYREPPAHYFGVPAVAANDSAALENAVMKALSANGPTVIEAVVDSEHYIDTVYD